MSLSRSFIIPLLIGLFSAGSAMAAASPREAAAKLIGSWYNEVEQYQGFDFQTFERGGEQEILTYWFTYDKSGNRLWITGEGKMDSEGVAQLTLFTGKGQFRSAATIAEIGTATLRPLGCTAATFTYDVKGGIISNERVADHIDLTRLSPLLKVNEEIACEMPGALTAGQGLCVAAMAKKLDVNQVISPPCLSVKSEGEGLCAAALIDRNDFLKTQECATISSKPVGLCVAAHIKRGYSTAQGISGCSSIKTEGQAIFAAALIAKDNLNLDYAKYVISKGMGLCAASIVENGMAQTTAINSCKSK